MKKKRGWPNPKHLPTKLLKLKMAEILSMEHEDAPREYETILNYQPEGGSARFINSLTNLLNRQCSLTGTAYEITNDQFFISPGASWAFDAVSRLLTHPIGTVHSGEKTMIEKDAFVCESPTYFLAPHIFLDRSLRQFEVPLDEEGLC